MGGRVEETGWGKNTETKFNIDSTAYHNDAHAWDDTCLVSMCYDISYVFYQEDKLRREKEKIDKEKKQHKSKDRKQKKKHRKHYFESESSATDSEDEMVQPSLKTTAMKPAVSYVTHSL